MCEPIVMPGKSVLQDDRAVIEDGMGNTGMHGRPRHGADAWVTKVVVVPAKHAWQKERASSIDWNRAGKLGRYS